MMCSIIYLLTGYPVRTEKYYARSHIVQTERSESKLGNVEIHMSESRNTSMIQ